MNFELSDVLKAIGPTASIIFAAWIFLSFLQTRYDAAINRYRALIEAYRAKDQSPQRCKLIKEEIEVYARRCTLMSRAVTIGLASAMLFLVTLVGADLDALLGGSPTIALISSITAILGFVLVIIAAGMVILENAGTPNQIKKEVEDLPDISGRSSSRFTKLTS